MFHRPAIDLIKDLHQTGRQLAVLKRMYQSYALIIRRILEKQKPFRELTKGATMDSATFQRSEEHGISVKAQSVGDGMNLEGQTLPTGETFGAPLSQPSVVRFERLLDRINLYALSEIQECLDEKDALVFMVSNPYFCQNCDL